MCVGILFRGLSLYGVPAFADSIHANGRVSATCGGRGGDPSLFVQQVIDVD